MSISKITLTGQVLRAPEKRFTEGDLAITTFTMNFGEEGEEKIIKVSSFRNVAERVEQTIKKGSNVVVEGRLQTNTVKTEAGTDKKYFEISAQSIESLGGADETVTTAAAPAEENFSLSEEISNDDLIGEDEIPF